MQLLSSSREGRRHQKHRLDGGAVSAHTLTRSLAGNLYKTLLNDSAWNVSNLDNFWETQGQGRCDKPSFARFSLHFHVLLLGFISRELLISFAVGTSRC